MNNTDNMNLSTWERIQNGVRDTERCIGQKKYNMAMVKARQTLEYMVKCLCEKSGVMEGSLIDMIDSLYEDGIISKTTSEHYHKIRTIGNKAIHEDDNNAYNANQAYHLLSQEVYTFANDYKERKKKPAAQKRASSTDSISTGRSLSAAGASSERTSAASSRSRSASAGSSRSMSAGSGRSMGSAGNRRRTRTSRSSIDLETILKPLLLIAIIIVLIFIIKMIHPGKEDTAETTPAVSTEAQMETDAIPEETEAPEDAAVIYKTSDILNVRSTPSTDNERIGVLTAGAEVEYVGDYDDTWAIIKFNGADAYVVKEYLTPVE